jgi:hypothetical protein
MKPNKITKWKDLTLRQTKSLMLLNTESEIFYNDAIKIVYDLNVDELEFSDFVHYKELINELFQDEVLTTNVDESQIQREYIIDGEKYYFQYNLSTNKGKMFLDLTKLLSEANENLYINIEQVMAVLIRPIDLKERKTNKFKINSLLNGKREKIEVEIDDIELEDYNYTTRIKRAELFLDKLNGEDAIKFQFFFTLFGLKYFLNILSFLNLQKGEVLKTNEDLGKHLDGQIHF